MVSRICVFVFLLSLVHLVLSQEDTVQLDEVTVSALQFERFTTGDQLATISLDETLPSLDQALSQQSSIYFKSYGNGQLASISFRGTSASQTNVLWHGISANYPTLGQMDFSQWPTWMMDELQLSMGANSSLYGNGAIGGTVLIDSDISHQPKGASLLLGGGSFGEFKTGIKATYGKGRVKAHTNLYRSFLQNDFKYEYNGETLRQNNASSLIYGLKQQMSYTIKGTRLFADFQYLLNDRDIQPTKSAPTSQDELTTKNTRLAIGANQEWAKSSLNVTFAYLQNDQIYNEIDQTTGNQYSSLVTYWFQLNDQLDFRVGGNTNLYTASSDSYSDEFHDLQADAFTSVSAKLIQWWQSVLNLRQSFYADQSHFVPSWSNELIIWTTENHKLKFNESFAFGFRYPTLNDRYWSPGGNLDLEPEKSKTLDGEFNVEMPVASNSLSIKFGGYHTWSKDWIVWLPSEAGYWVPQNFREVEISGLESSLEISGDLFGDYQFNASYTYNRSINKTGSNSGKLLPYTPEHNALVSWQHQIKKYFNYRLNSSFTGKRYTTLDNTERSSVAPFFILDFTLGREFELPLFDISIDASINNLLDANYENLNNRAMPGRNYQLQLIINYNNR